MTPPQLLGVFVRIIGVAALLVAAAYLLGVIIAFASPGNQAGIAPWHQYVLSASFTAAVGWFFTRRADGVVRFCYPNERG